MTKYLTAALLLIATSAGALTFERTETRLSDITVCVMQAGADPAFLVSFRTYDGEGLIREISNRNLWLAMSSEQRTQVRGMLATVSAALHQTEQVPTPTPTSAPTPTP